MRQDIIGVAAQLRNGKRSDARDGEEYRCVPAYNPGGRNDARQSRRTKHEDRELARNRACIHVRDLRHRQQKNDEWMAATNCRREKENLKRELGGIQENGEPVSITRAEEKRGWIYARIYYR
jgi:hypothetical protein